jgi:hypothetical protein
VSNKLKGHYLHLTNEAKCLWYFDSFERQERAKTKRTNNQIWVHKGHLKGKVRLGRITDDMRQSIDKMAKENVSVASIQTLLLRQYGVHISDHQIHHCLTTLGWDVTEDSLTKDKVPAAGRGDNDCTALLRSLTGQKGVSFCVLVENVGRSTEYEQVFESYIMRAGAQSLELFDDAYDGTDCCKKTAPPTKGIGARHGEEEINGRIYDKEKFVTILGQKVFFISVVWVSAREVRTFAAYPEVLVMDDKKKTNKHHHSFFLVSVLMPYGEIIPCSAPGLRTIRTML